MLRVEIGEVRHEVFDDRHVRQRIDADFTAHLINRFGAGEGIGAVDIHSAGTANALAAGAPEGERRIRITFDLDQRVEHHGAAIVGVDLERVGARIVARVRIVAIDLKLARLTRASRRRMVFALLDLRILGVKQPEILGIFHKSSTFSCLDLIFGLSSSLPVGEKWSFGNRKHGK